MGSSPTAVASPVYNPVNIPQTATDAMNADIAGFNWSDANTLANYPGLVAGNTANIQQTYNALNGPLDSTVQNQFVSQGASGALGSFGGGNPMATLGDVKSGAGSNATASSLANQTMNLQDANRTAWDTITNQSQNLPRAAGLSGGDIANLSIANSGGLSASNQAAYAGSVNQSNASNAQSNANTTAEASAAAAVLAAVIAAL